MMTRTLAGLACIPLSLISLSLAAPLPARVALGSAPGAEVLSDLDALVQAAASAADELQVSELWGRALELRKADQLGELGELDAALDRQLHQRETLSSHARLLLTACRLQGEDLDAVALVDGLKQLIVGAESEELALGAVSLLENKVFRDLNRGSRADLVQILAKVYQNTDNAPAYRIEFAKGAYSLGTGADRRAATEMMNGYLLSADSNLQSLGALALAAVTQSEITGRLRTVLESLAAVPNERGRLAAAYIAAEDANQYSQTKLRELRSKLENQSIGKKLPADFEEILAVLDLIEGTHLEGNRVTREELVRAGVNGMLRWMDPHSNYLDSEVYSKFFQDLEAEYSGIGAYVREDADNGLFTIVRPIYSGPAYKAGIVTDDKIVKIDDWPTLGQSEADIIKHLKGPAGSEVTLYIWKRGMDPETIDRPTEDMKVTVVRNRIEIPAGSNQLLPGGIGLVELTEFSKSSQEQMKEWILSMQADGMTSLILDMRRNSGGLLTEARDVADLFLPKGVKVVSTEGRQGEPEVLRTRTKAMIPADMPVIILTSRLTASAAEIVSGALQDHGRATLIGKRTYGKGSVQQLIPILYDRQDRFQDLNGNRRWDQGEPITMDANGNGEMDYCPRVKLTIARYLLPSGRSIHRTIDREGNLISPGGVEPDFQVDLPLIERWRFDERTRISNELALKEYLDRNYEANQSLFHQLALNDTKDPSLYPEFDRLMVELDTKLDRDDVRRVLRTAVRRRVQDDLGREFPFGDFVEDIQVQKGIEVALQKLGIAASSIPELQQVFEMQPAESKELASAGIHDPKLNRVREILNAAQSGGTVLSDESYGELLKLIDKLESGSEN